MLEVAES